MSQTKPGLNIAPEWAPTNLLETITDGISVQDTDMRIVYANGAHRKMFGDDIVGKLCYEVYERRSQICEGCPVRECFETGCSASALRVGIDKNGAYWFGDVVATPLRNQDGDIVGAVEMVRNVTERKLIEQEVDRRNQETAAIAEVAMVLNRHVDLDEILSVAIRCSVDVSGAVGGLLRLLDEKTQVLMAKAWHAADEQPIPESILKPQDIGTGIVGRAAQTKEIQVIDDLEKELGSLELAYSKGLIQLGLKSIIVVPLVSQEKLVGTLALGSFENNRFRDTSKELLLAIASQIAIAIERALLQKELKEKIGKLEEILAKGKKHESPDS